MNGCILPPSKQFPKANLTKMFTSAFLKFNRKALILFLYHLAKSLGKHSTSDSMTDIFLKLMCAIHF